MKIYTSAGTEIIDVVVNDDSDRQSELMGHDMLMLRFSLEQSVDFAAYSRCYCTWEGCKYIMFNAPECTKANSRKYDYVLTMYTYEYLLSITAMRDLIINYGETPWTFTGGNKTKFPLTATPREHLQMIADCLNKAEGSEVWKVDYSRTIGMTPLLANEAGAHQNYDGTFYADDGDMMLVNYENQYCIDAIKEQANVFNTEYEVEDKTYNNNTQYHLLCLHKVEYNKDAALQMKYGIGHGFVSGIARRNQTETPPLDRLYVQGGEQNIPEHYGQTEDTSATPSTWSGTKERMLLLPKPYSDSYQDGVKNIRYNGDTIYYETKEDGYVYYWFNLEKVFKYGLAQGGVYGYMEADADPMDTRIVQVTPPMIEEANTWKRYEIDDDRRSIYRSNPSSRTPLRSTNVEGFYDGSEVYPMRVGTVYDVQEVNNDGTAYTNGEKYYDIFDNDPSLLDGSLDYRYLGIGGETMTVIFQDGMLAGREFDIQTVGDGTNVKPNCGLVSSNTKYCIPLCQSEQDGIVMPSEPFIPAINNHYIVFHCELPESYVINAEMRMLWQAVDYMYYRDDYTYNFSGNVDEIFVKSNWDTTISPATSAVSVYMAIGQYINVTDVDLFGANGQTMRVTSVKQKVNNKYDIDLSLSNAPQKVFDWAKKLSKTVETVNERLPHWRPINNILPPQVQGTRSSLPILNIIDTTDNRPTGLTPSRGGGSRRNTILPVVNSSVESLEKAQEYLEQCQKAVNDICDDICASSDFDGLKEIIAEINPDTNLRKNVEPIGDENTCRCYKPPTAPAYCELGKVDIKVPEVII